MKNLFLIPGLILVMAACNAPKDSGDSKRAELEKLRKEEADLQIKIASLEAEIGATDTVQAPITISVSTLKASCWTPLLYD